MGLRTTMVVRSNDIPKLVDGMVAAVAEEVRKTVFDIEAIAKIKAPIEFGTLMNSITGSADGLSGEVGTGVDYAIYQEYGTVNMPAHPYMTPAAEMAWPDFLAGVQKALGG